MKLQLLRTTFLMSAVACSAIGQEDAEQDARDRFVETEVNGEYLSQLVNAMSLEIDDMARVLKLDDKAVRRLKLAAKGAATKTVDQYGPSIVRFAKSQIRQPHFRINGREVRLEEPEKKDPSEPKDDAPPTFKPQRVVIFVKQRQVNVNVREERSSSGTGTTGGTDSVKGTEIWKKTFKAVVTDEQLKQYEEHQKEQQRRACVRLVSAWLMLELRLREELRPKVTDWVSKTVTEVKPSDLTNGTDYIVRNIVGRIDTSGFKEIITPAQAVALRVRLAEWNW